MITGTVLHRRILVNLTMRGPAAREAEIEFVLDTGFTGVLTMMPTICKALGLHYICPQTAQLADGSSVILEVYQAALFWNGEEHNVEILAIEGAPLIGMTLLEDSDVHFQGKKGGIVRIEAL